MTDKSPQFPNALSIRNCAIFWAACVFVSCAVAAGGAWWTARQHGEMIRQIEASDVRATEELGRQIRAIRHQASRTPAPAGDELRATTAKLLDAADAYVTTHRDDLISIYRAELAHRISQERWEIVLLAAAAVLLGAGLSGLWLRVLRPISELRRTAARLGAGDYAARAPTTRSDEIGALCGELNGLAALMESNAAEQRKRVEELQDVALLADTSPYPIMRSSNTGKLLYANRAAAALLEIWNTSVGAAVPATVQEEVREALSANANRASRMHWGNRVFRLVSVPIADRGYANLYGRDITARERMVEALVHSRDELEQRVRERTAELNEANQALHADVLERSRTEKRLQESEARFRSMFEEAPIGMMLVSADNRILQANRAHCEFLGYSAQELAGMNVLDVTYPEDRDESTRVIHRIHEGAVRIEGHGERYVRKNGDVVWGEASLSIISDADGKLVHTIAQIVDITERRRAEEALREKEETIRALLNATTDNVFLLDTAGMVLAANETSARGWNRTVEQLIGTCAYDFMTPSVAQSRRAHFARCVEAGEPVHFEDEHRGAWYETTTYPIRDSQGTIARMAIYGRDITERKRAEQALRESEQRYRELFEASPVALIEGDWTAARQRAEQLRAGGADVRAWFLSHPEEALVCVQRLDANKAALQLFKASDKKEFLTRFDQLRSSVSREAAIQAIAALAAGEGFFEAETSLETLTGEKRNVLMSMSSAPAGEKSLPRYIVALSDVTELRKAQQEAIEQRQAAQLQRMESLAVTGRLAAGVAHEINNPLQGIVAQLTLLATELPEPLRQGRRISLIQDGIDRIAGIVRNLLQLHRPAPTGEESCAVSSVIPGLADMISAMTANQHISLDVSVHPPGMTIPMASNALMQVLLNLVLNAIDAMPQGGVLQIEAKRTAETALVSVSDTGVGIPPEHHRRLFSPFFTTKGPKGTGLGLSVTYSLVTSAGGTITVNDRPEGGTTFAIRFEKERAK